MLDMTHLGKMPEGLENLTIKNETVKIDVLSITPRGEIEIPVRIIRKEVSIMQYSFLRLILNYYTYAN